MKKRLYIKGFLIDAATTILHLPINLAVCLYAPFAQCVLELKYDFTNNVYEVRDGKKENN